MKIKCSYCGNMTDETKEKCEHCNAPNEYLKRVGEGVPKTIEELKQWYTAHNLPEPEITRFFIGEDYKKPRAFGIYKNSDGNFIVYKNKDTGERAIRYEGKDEVYAVNELYLRLKEEIQGQKSRNSKNSNKKTYGMWLWKGFNPIIIISIIIITMFAFGALYTKDNGYYNYDGTEYYKRYNNWYIYDNNSGWSRISSDRLDSNFSNSYNDYYEGDNYSDTTFGGENIYDSSVSDSWSSSTSSDDWDSDSNWDSGSSWDSGSTDWSSDW